LLVRGLAETVSIPKELLKDLYAGLVRVEEVLATLEELMDREGLERIRKAEREYVKGEYVTVKDSSESARSEKLREGKVSFKRALTKYTDAALHWMYFTQNVVTWQ
jgi:hypothetical protein